MKKLIIIMHLVWSGLAMSSDNVNYIAPSQLGWSNHNENLAYSTSHTYTFNVKERQLAMRDALIPIDTCETEKDWLCIYTGLLDFAIKKEWTELPLEWRHNGYSFKVTESKTISLFGVKRKVFIIVAFNEQFKDRIINVFFNLEYGIQGFEVYVKDEEEEYQEGFWLSSDKGLLSK